jgi:predicted RNA-binding Zn-ribbon protein involved in translation (DUF1610 family)
MADATCCGQYYEVGDELIGHAFTCPKCGNRMVFRNTFSGSSSTLPTPRRPTPPQNVAASQPVRAISGNQWFPRGLNQRWLAVGLIAALAMIAFGVTLYKLPSAGDDRAAISVAMEELQRSPDVLDQPIMTAARRSWTWDRQYRVEFLTTYRNEYGETHRGIVICTVNLDRGETRLTHNAE